MKLKKILYIVVRKKSMNFEEIERDYEIDVEKGTVFSKKSGKYIGSKNKKNKYVYLALCINNEIVFDGAMHRLIWQYYHKQEIPKGYEIDHIDTNPSNNSISNLRLCTRKENCNNELTRQHYSNAKKGKYIGENHPQCRPIAKIDKNSGEVLEIQPYGKKFKELYGFDNGVITECCRGKKKTHRGFKWRYAEDLL